MEIELLEFKPIGVVRNNAGMRRYNEWREVISEIIIDPEYTEALYRLEEFSHIYVLFYFHKINEPFKKRVHPTRNPKFPLMGAFATRTPNRPNSIALTLCELLGRKENVLTVKGLDAFNGSPVIDIKPFSSTNIDEKVQVPDWIQKLGKRVHKG